MGNEMQKFENSGKMLETVLVDGDLSGLAPEQRVSYYQAVCESLGLNPLTKPFDYLKLNGRLVLYARKDATDQLRNLNGVSITKLERETIGDIMTVTAYAAMAGRTDASTGAVSVKDLRGDALANAIMKAETKAKRRVTLSICGLGALDETEIETIRDAQPVTVAVTGEVIQVQPQEFTTRDGRPYGALSLDELTTIKDGLERGIASHNANTPRDAKERLSAIGALIEEYTAEPDTDDAAGRATIAELQAEAEAVAETLTPPMF
jgi:hypothetical protein